MASGSDRDDVVSSQALMEKNPTTKSQQIFTFTATLTPAPALPTLPFDLVSEILCRLPVKLLLQLRCLCKSLNSLISDPKFAKKHLRLS
ncbi:F-box/kelch-repeat protein, partial [Trifolium medium]|nr:F-box/kelch-repeat protein [Trifolium medium]